MRQVHQRPDAAPGEDPPDRVRPLRGTKPQDARARQTGDLQVPGLCIHLCQIPTGRLPTQAEVSRGSYDGEATGDKGSVTKTNARANPGGREMARADRRRIFRLSCRADQQHGVTCVSLSCRRTLAPAIMPAQPEGVRGVGADGETGGRISPQAPYPSSLAKCAVCRQIPKVGAECGNPARSDLCGGTGVTRFPTAIKMVVRRYCSDEVVT